MNQNIESICKSLEAASGDLQMFAKENLANIAVAPRPTSTVVATTTTYPGRPWKVAGTAGIIVGVIGLLSSNSIWPYIVGAAGLGSVCYGMTRKPEQDSQVSSPTSSSTPTYVMAEKLLQVIKEVEKKWKEKVETAKDGVQGVINASQLSNSAKDELLGETYYTERISIDETPMVTALENAAPTEVTMLINTSSSMITQSIRETAVKQISVYQSISAKL